MLIRFRNKAIKDLSLSFCCLLALLLSLWLRRLGLANVVVTILAVVFGVFSLLLYVQGNMALAEAKGYHSSVVGAIIVVSAICTYVLFIGLPLILIFGLKDKTKRAGDADDSEPEPTRRNPLATLPPVRDDDPLSGSDK